MGYYITEPVVLRIFKFLIIGLVASCTTESQINVNFVGSLKGRSFATGFIAEGRVIAPLHFVLRNCDQNLCEATFNSPATTCNKLELVGALATVDLAVLKCLEPLKTKGFRIKRDFKQNIKKGRVYIAVANRDSSMQTSVIQGRIKSTTRIMQMISTRVTFGASGAPVFDQAGKVVGVVTRAENLFDALVGTFIPFYKFSAKSVNIKYVRHLLTREKRLRDILRNDLLDHYRRQIRHQSKLKRFFESVEFTGLINKYVYDLRGDLEVQRVFLLRENPFWQKEKVSDSNLFPLIVAYHLEKFGTFGIKSYPESSDVAELIDVYSSLGYRGQSGFFVGLALLLTVWGSFLIFTLLSVLYGKLTK